MDFFLSKLYTSISLSKAFVQKALNRSQLYNVLKLKTKGFFLNFIVSLTISPKEMTLLLTNVYPWTR